jgi:hypothetical protein
VDSIFCSSWDDYPATLWILPTFSDPQNMNRDDLTAPVAAAATSQVKLCPLKVLRKTVLWSRSRAESSIRLLASPASQKAHFFIVENGKYFLLWDCLK